MKRFGLITAVSLATALLLSGCGNSSAAKGSSFAQANTESTGLEASAEGYSESGDGYTMEVSWYETDDVDIYGRFFYPEDFDEGQTYPTIVMCHGGEVTADIFSKIYAPYLANQGYVCYAFDCRSGSDKGRGSYSKELGDDNEATALTYAEDLNMALDFVETKDFVDKSHIYLFGQSMGGVATQEVASQRNDEIDGIVVLYGSVNDDNEEKGEAYQTVYEDIAASPYENGEVLFIQGANDNFRTVETTTDNMELYPENASFIEISNAGHGFGNTEDRPTEITCEAVADFVKRSVAGEEQEDLSPATEEQKAVSDEGYTIEGDGFKSVVTWFENGEYNLFGRTYYPEDFDESKTYPTMVMCHGAGVNADFWDAVYAPALAKAGYVCFTYDCRNSGAGFRGSYSDPIDGDPELDSTVNDYISDTNAALDYVESLSFVDTASIYLFGQSKGGGTAQIVASQRHDEIKGLVVVYGALSVDIAKAADGYEETLENPYADGEVLMLLGNKDNVMSLDDVLADYEMYDLASLVYINDAAHGFGNHNTRPAQIAADEMVNFVQRTLSEEE